MEAQFHKSKDPPYSSSPPKKGYNHHHKNDLVLLCIHVSKSKNRPRYIYVKGLWKWREKGPRRKLSSSYRSAAMDVQGSKPTLIIMPLSLLFNAL